MRDSPAVDVDRPWFFKIVRAAFSQRRKRAVNAVSAGLSLDKAAVEQAFSQAGLPPDIRAERITLEGFAALSRLLPRQGGV